MTMPMMIQTLLTANGAGDISTGGPSASGKTRVNGVFAALMRQTQNTGNAAGTKAQSSPVALKGHALVSYLKKNLQSSGVSLDQSMADDSALAAIGKVLLGAGFEAVQVKNLLGELKTNAGGNGVRVSTLFEGISRLTEPSAATSKTAYLEISALPHIETLLAKFGLTPDQIKSALSGAKVEGKGIDAERLAAELKRLWQGGGSKKDISQEDVEPEQILSMMQQIGLTIPLNPTGSLNLESLVSALQKFAGRNASSLDKGVSAMANANKSSQAVLNHLKQGLGQSISAGDGRLSLDRFAAELEMAAGLRDGGAPSQLKQEGDWDLFVRNIKSVSTGNASASELRTSPLLSGMAAPVPQSEISNSLFSDPAFFQPVSGKRGLVEKGSNRQIKSGPPSGLTSIEGSDLLKAETLSHRDNTAATHSTVSQPVSIKGNFAEKGVNGQNLAGSKTGQFTAGSPDATKAGWADAIIAGVSAEKNLEEAIVTAAAKVSEPGGEALPRTGKTVRKSSDSAVPLLGDGINRRSETSDSTPLSTPDRPAGREFPQYLLDQVSRQILRSRLANESEILIQLKPATLGRLKMSIENSADGLKVSIIAESQAARDMLLSNSGDLKTALMDQGVRLDQIDVETQADFNQSMADTRQGSEGSGGRKGFTGGNRIRVETAASAIEPREIARNGSSVLNLVA